MRLRLLPLAVALAALACGGNATPPSPSPGGAPAPPAAVVLVVTHTAGFRHDSIPAAEAALTAIGSESGLYRTEFCRTAAEVQARLTPTGLAGVDAVFFANTTGDLGIADMSAFLAWVRAGKAFLGAHSAADTYHESPPYLEMLGGEFVTHGSIVEADVRVNDPAFPAVSHLAPRFAVADEWYRFRQTTRDLHTLLSFDRNPADGVGIPGQAVDLPLAWTRGYGSGRVFYTALGHRAELWGEARFRAHLREALRWALGR